ncbi:MAG: tetratricopeptide repeat protein [Luteolibacter sp.]
MNFRRHLVFASAVMVWMVPVWAQDENLEALVAKAQLAMKASQWKQALDLHTQAVTSFGQDQPLEKFGAQFGAVFYHKGVCEMKLGKWTDAMASFETCYRDFPNTGRDSGNRFQHLALCKWGEAAMGAGEWEVAASRFAKFMSERDRTRDAFPHGSFYVNLAICHYRLGRIPEGNENLEIASRNKVDFPTPESGIVAGFQALVGAAIAGRNEQVLLDFIGRNRAALMPDSPEDAGGSHLMLKLAGDALAAEMQWAALAIYQLIPPASGNAALLPAPDAIRLAAVALIHEKAGNVRGAYACYLQLEANHPGAGNRESSLHQLVRTASVIGEFEAARRHAGKLRRDFPGSAFLEEIRALGIDPLEGLPVVPPPGDAGAVVSKALPDSREFAAALDLYQGRKYQDALAAFRKIMRPEAGGEADAAALYEMECLRKSGDFEGLEQALTEFKGHSNLDANRLRQLEIHRLRDAVRKGEWERADAFANQVDAISLPADQRCQVAFCHGLAFENAGRLAEALIAHNMAMTADAGASEDVARLAAIRVMTLHLADPEVRAAMDRWGTVDDDKDSPGLFRLKEAAAVAVLFERSLGAGSPLPDELGVLLKYRDVR